MFPINQRDLRASLVVVLVALPFCAGVAPASGLGFERGVLTALIGGLVTSCLGGARLQISGPSVSMGLILLPLVTNYGAACVGPVVAVAGIVQLLAAASGAAGLFRWMTPAVLAGAVCAAGLSQAAAQAHVAAGASPHAFFLLNLADMGRALAGGNPSCLLVACATLVVALGWHRRAPRVLRGVPGPVMAAAAGAAVCTLLPGPVPHLPELSLASLYISQPGMLWTAWNMLHEPALLSAAVLIACMGTAESMVSAEAAAWSVPSAKADMRREMLVQGAGNLVCGLFGALPLAGAVPRSSANIRAGASGPSSNMLHAVWLLAVVAICPRLLALVPVPALAALLVLGGWRLAFERTRLTEAVCGTVPLRLFLVTLSAALAISLPAGVAAGALCAAAVRILRPRPGVVRLPENQPA